jgi:predicted HAD superfamily hydrolase
METNSLMLWQRDESLREAGARLAETKSGIRVVSFDFFDTLVSRVCGEPNDLFIEVGRQLAARGLFVRPFTPMEFYSVRIAADERARKNAARQGCFPEIKLADIYAELKNVVTDAEAACQLEFDLERTYCYLNPAVASLVQHAKALGYKVAVISDTYFTAAQLQQLLRENDFPPSLFDLFLVSCERGNAKWSGQLYQDLLRHFDIHPGELLHFGDNLHADYHASRQFGVQAVHYYKTTTQLDQLLSGEKNLRSSDQHFAGALNSIRILAARRAESDQDAFRDGAFVFGPVLARYADWCVEKFKAANVRTVLALMREGELLGELVRRSAAAAKIDLKIMTCFTSRRATARAAMSELTPAGALELLEGSSTVTLQSVLEVLGLGEEIARQFDPKSLRKPMPTPESINELLKLLFENPRIRELIEAGRKESFDLAFAYLSSLIGGEDNVGILDLGWGGSIQRNITRVLRRGGCKIRTVGCYLARTRKSGRLALDGDEVHAFMEQEWSRSTILPELAITSPVGSTNSYERDASGAIRPVLGAYELSSAEQLVKARLRDGILEFQSFWLKLRRQKKYSPETLADMDQQTASIFYRLLEYPSKAEADRLGVLTHDENYFGESFSAPLCDDQTPRHLQRDGVQAVFQAARCYWPQGVVARNNPRLITALRSGWNDYLSLGRIGAWHGTPIGEGGLTDEEASTLGTLVNSLSLQQIIFVGPLVPVLEEVFQFLWRHEARPAEALKNKPRLIAVGPVGGMVASPEFLSRCVLVDGDLNDPRTVRAIRAELVPGVNAALVMPGELSDTIARRLLNGLAPFLGPEGVMFTACGRFDRNTIAETLPMAKAINAWLKENGRELGFGLWTGNATVRAQLCNWIVLRRAPAQAVWNNQWMFTAADLAFAEETGDLLLAKP